MKRDAIDFHLVPDRQLAMHARLENWARSLFGEVSGNASPMFRLYRSSEVHEVQQACMPCDANDAVKVAKGVRELPESHRAAINWYYVQTGAPMKACRSIGCTMADLAQYTVDGRQMLINRRV